MKKLLITFIALLSLAHVVEAQVKVKVDERYELVSTTFALAGVPEYCQCNIPSYWQDINTDMTPFEYTPVIDFVRELNQLHGIGYNAVSSVASMLEIKNGKIKLNKKYDISKISEYDSRWSEKLLTEYIKHLNVFYKQSNFKKFYERHSELYALAENSFNNYFADIMTSWFQQFFGDSLDVNSIMVYISLLNGPHNYATPEGVLLGVECDDDGNPAPNVQTMSLLVHEMGHHYTNPICEKYWDQMQTAGNTIYEFAKDDMAKINYGDAYSMICEWMNRLFVLMYINDNDSIQEKSLFLTSLELENGFIWMQRSMEFMRNFNSNRSIYPTIEDFMPQLVAFLNYTADNYDYVQREWDTSRPYIKSIYPAPGSDITNTNEILITFSEPMTGASFGFDISLNTDENGVLNINSGIEVLWTENIEWQENDTQLKLVLTPGKREYGHSYGLRLNPSYFQSARYFQLDDKCKDIIFKL